MRSPFVWSFTRRQSLLKNAVTLDEEPEVDPAPLELLPDVVVVEAGELAASDEEEEDDERLEDEGESPLLLLSLLLPLTLSLAPLLPTSLRPSFMDAGHGDDWSGDEDEFDDAGLEEFSEFDDADEDDDVLERDEDDTEGSCFGDVELVWPELSS